MDKEQALQQFYESFLPNAYEENSVPDDVEYDYLTYDMKTDVFGSSHVALSLSVWTRSTSWKTAVDIKNKITKAIGLGGINIPCDEGIIWLTMGNPFAQRMGDPNDDLIKRYVININADFNTIF